MRDRSCRRGRGSCDRDAVPRARMRVSECPPAHLPRRSPFPWRHGPTIGRALPVPELAHVEVAVSPSGPVVAHPAEHDVAGCLHHSLPLDDALALIRRTRFCRGTAPAPRAAPPCTAGTADPARRVRASAPSSARADAADADDLAREVHVAVALEQSPPVAAGLSGRSAALACIASSNSAACAVGEQILDAARSAAGR